MTTIPNFARTVKVYFSNGVNPNTPWQCGVAEGSAITGSCGSFPNAEEAIAQGAQLANRWQMALEVPYWVQRIADRAQQRADDLRYADLRANDDIGRPECAGGF